MFLIYSKTNFEKTDIFKITKGLKKGAQITHFPLYYVNLELILKLSCP